VLILSGSVAGYVDFGITGSLSAHSRRTIVAMVLALVRGDADEMRDHYLRLATIRPWSDVSAYSRGLRRLMDEWFAEDAGVRRLRASFTTVMVDLLQLSRRTFLLPSPDAIRYMRSIAIDGPIHRFAPEFDAPLPGGRPRPAGRAGVPDLALAAGDPDWDGQRLLLCAPEALGQPLPSAGGGTAPAAAPASGANARPRRLVRGPGSAALVLAALGQAPPGLGFNVFTAELAVGGLGALGFALTTRKET
jgi:hypothetical protein